MSHLDLNLNKEFLGKKIIVTGASKGLGAEACKALAGRGAEIAMLSRSKKEMDRLKNNMKNPKKHISIKVNFLNNKGLENAFKQAVKFLKNIDIILHVAGGGFGLKDSLIKHKDLNTLFQINLGAAVEINRLAVNKKKKIMNLS